MSEKYIELKKENLIFDGKTEKEKKINETIYDLCLENDALYEENKELKRINGSLQSALSLSRQKYNNSKNKYRKKYKELKKQLYSPDQVEFTCSKCGEKFSVNYSREVYDLNNILTEFEKWLEEEMKRKNSRWEQFHNQINTQELVLERLNAQIVFIDCCLKRIQELKEGKK